MQLPIFSKMESSEYVYFESFATSGEKDKKGIFDFVPQVVQMQNLFLVRPLEVLSN